VIENLQHLPAFYWLMLTAIAVIAIYVMWGRKKATKEAD
jgi:hypothetical protein